MKLVGKIHRFNTGRRYGNEGQLILWAVFQQDQPYRRVVVFFDQDRHIEGCIELYIGNMDLVNDDWVLRAYDDHHWHYDGDAFVMMRAVVESEKHETSTPSPWHLR